MNGLGLLGLLVAILAVPCAWWVTANERRLRRFEREHSGRLDETR